MVSMFHTFGNALMRCAISRYDLCRTHLPAAIHDRNFSLRVGAPVKQRAEELSLESQTAYNRF